jgi:hypothetical protein
MMLFDVTTNKCKIMMFYHPKTQFIRYSSRLVGGRFEEKYKKEMGRNCLIIINA